MKNVNRYSTDELSVMLYNKAKAEQDTFIEGLKVLPPEKIIEASYEKVIRDDLLMTFESKDFSREQVKELLKLDNPLAECYDRWLSNDYSYMDMLEDTIDEFADKLVEQAAQQKKAKKNQPER